MFQTSAWATFLQESRRGEPVFVRWVDASGKLAALAVGLIRSPVKSRLGRAALTLAFDAPPAIAHGASTPRIEPLAAWARREGVIALHLGSFDCGGRPWCGNLRDYEERIEFVATPGDEHELWRRMRKGTRSAIRRAERLGVDVEAVGNDHVAQFVLLFASTLERLRRDKGVAIGEVDAKTFGAGLEGLLAARRGRLYLARLGDEDVGGCFFGVEGRSAYYLFNGSNATAREVGAMPLMLLRAMSDFSEEGIDRINLGGVPASASDPSSPDHGLYAFKLGLGAEPVICRGGRIPLRRIRLTLLDFARTVRAKGVLTRAVL